MEELEQFTAKWNALVEGGRYPDVTKDFEVLFGEAPVKFAVREYAERRTRARETGSLYASRDAGMLLTSAAPTALKVANHTFFGGPDDE